MQEATNILFVTDDLSDAEIVRQALSRSDSNTRVHVARCLAEAQVALAARPVDLILADWLLSDGDASALLRKDPAGARAPVVVMTSAVNETAAVEAIKAGALDYVVKSPQALEEIPHTIARALHTWQVQLAHEAAEKQLRFRSLVLDQIADNVTITDLDGRILYINASLERLTGTQRETLSGEHVDAFTTQAESGVTQAEILRITLTDGGWSGRVIHRDTEGIPHTLHLRTSLICDENSRPIGCCGISTDVTAQRQAEERTLSLRAELDSILHAVPDAIYRLDPQGRITFVSEGIRRYGYPPDALLGQRFIDLISPDDRLAAAVHLAGNDTQAFETRLAKPDGALVAVEIISRPLHTAADTEQPPQFLGTQGIARDITPRKQAEEDIHLLTRELIRAQELERLRISLDLHDHVAQNMAVARISCDSLRQMLPPFPPEIQSGLDKIARLIETSIASIRSLSQALRPPGLEELGLVQTLSDYCAQFAAETNISVDFQATGIDQLAIGYETKIHVYRMVQEGLTNIRKHAQATRVQIRLVASSPLIIARVQDNGRGFDPHHVAGPAAGASRMGIQGMRERVSLLGGRLHVRSQPGLGTELRIEIPIQEDSYA